jgi:hypothetical protein
MEPANDNAAVDVLVFKDEDEPADYPRPVTPEEAARWAAANGVTALIDLD